MRGPGAAGPVRIAVTLGDPAGIGPEVTLKALSAWVGGPRPLLLGNASFYSTLAKRLKLKMRFVDVSDAMACPTGPVFACYSDFTVPQKLSRGRSDKHLTRLAVRSIELGVRLALDKKVHAIVTPPINKAGLAKAGLNIPGHTEYLARLSRANRFEMMLVGGPLRVVLVTRHMPLSRVARSLTRRRVKEAILTADLELRRSFGIRRPRLVVCGLNPHAGEEGNIGREEITVIRPAVAAAKRQTDARITGPLSPDALFHDAYRGAYDAEVCMYHDQGLIPLKMISRGAGVNVTLGLPFVRTSPDHGTGYDIARLFRADAGSMAQSLKLAALLARNRRRHALSHRTS